MSKEARKQEGITPSKETFTTPSSSSSFLHLKSPSMKGEVRLREMGLGFERNSYATDDKGL